MATTTKKKGTTKRRTSSGAPRRKAVASAPVNGKKGATLHGSDDDPDQTYIEGTQPEKVPELENVLELWIASNREAEDADSKISDCRTKAVEILEEKKIPSYKYNGYTVKLRPGSNTALLSKPRKK